LSKGQKAEMETLTQSNLATVKAYQIRLGIQDAYPLATVAEAKSRLKAWCRWVRMGSKRFGVLFTEMEKVANAVEKHTSGILAHWKYRITNAFIEGLNSLFSAVKSVVPEGFAPWNASSSCSNSSPANSSFQPSSHPPKTTKNQKTLKNLKFNNCRKFDY
jgi:hypothetical protein